MSVRLTCRIRAVVLLLTLALAAGIALGSAQQREPQGRLFRPADLGLLEGPDRDAWQKPDGIMDALGIADGSIVADLGAGGGWFTVRLARRVGPNGRVYAEDIQALMIEAIDRRVSREGLTNVRTILGTPEDPKLPSGLDAVLIVDAYHEMADPVTLLRRVAAALKPNGRIGIVDFKLEGGGPGPDMSERVEPELVIQNARAAGLALVSSETFLRYQYFLIFGGALDAGGSHP